MNKDELKAAINYIPILIAEHDRQAHIIGQCKATLLVNFCPGGKVKEIITSEDQDKGLPHMMYKVLESQYKLIKELQADIIGRNNQDIQSISDQHGIKYKDLIKELEAEQAILKKFEASQNETDK